MIYFQNMCHTAILIIDAQISFGYTKMHDNRLILKCHFCNKNGNYNCLKQVNKNYGF